MATLANISVVKQQTQSALFNSSAAIIPSQATDSAHAVPTWVKPVTLVLAGASALVILLSLSKHGR